MCSSDLWEGTDFEVELPTHNPGYNIVCYQRCLLSNTDRNSGGNRTDPGCGNSIHEVRNTVSNTVGTGMLIYIMQTRYTMRILEPDGLSQMARGGTGSVAIKAGRCCP